MELENPLSIYIHIPFCLKKCGYCDFHSAAMRPEDVPQKDYALAVCEELKQLKDKYGFSGRRVGTIYFGGGTPTVFEPANLNIILDAIHKNFSVASDAEISIEANPETIPLVAGVRGLLDVGFNRLSIGIQSFNDGHLRALGRIHNADTARRAVRAAQEAGFENIGIDLMWGLPGQTLKELGHDIDAALALGVQHISAYQLTVGEGLNPAGWWGCPLPKFWEPAEGLPYKIGRASSATTLPSEDLAHEMFLLVHDKLTSAGYEHYEISNFAKNGDRLLFPKVGKVACPRFRCRHNLNYWRYGKWLGVGSGATSFIACHCERQRSNPIHSIEYTGSPRPSRHTRGARDDIHLVRLTSTKDISKYLRHEFSYDVEEIPLRSAIAEYSFMNLRTSDGIDLNNFKRRFEREFDDVYPGLIAKWVKNGWAEVKTGSDPAVAKARKNAFPSEKAMLGSDPIFCRLSLSGWLISDELFRELV